MEEWKSSNVGDGWSIGVTTLDKEWRLVWNENSLNKVQKSLNDKKDRDSKDFIQEKKLYDGIVQSIVKYIDYRIQLEEFDSLAMEDFRECFLEEFSEKIDTLNNIHHKFSKKKLFSNSIPKSSRVMIEIFSTLTYNSISNI